MLGSRNSLVFALTALLANCVLGEGARQSFSTENLSQMASGRNRNIQMRDQTNGAQGGAQADSAGGQQGGAGGGGLQYMPREQNKLSPDKGDDASVMQSDMKQMQDGVKQFNQDVAKMTQNFYQQLEKSKVPESDALVKQLANSPIVSLSGVGASAVAGIINDEKSLGDTISKGYTTQAMAFASQPKAPVMAKPPSVTMGDQIAAATNNSPSSSGSPIGAAQQAQGLGGYSIPQRISGPGANLGGGVHAAGAVTHFQSGLLYNAPKPGQSGGWSQE